MLPDCLFGCLFRLGRGKGFSRIRSQLGQKDFYGNGKSRKGITEGSKYHEDDVCTYSIRCTNEAMDGSRPQITCFHLVIDDEALSCFISDSKHKTRLNFHSPFFTKERKHYGYLHLRLKYIKSMI